MSLVPVERQEATAFLASELVQLVLGMLKHPTCPVKDPKERATVGGDALLSAFLSFLRHCGATEPEAAALLRKAADMVESGETRATAIAILSRSSEGTTKGPVS